MRNRFIVICLFLINSSAIAQEYFFKEAVFKVFYHEKVRNLLFLKYDNKDTTSTFYKTYNEKSVFIMPDRVVRESMPDVLYRVAGSWGEEKQFSTMTFIQNGHGNIFITNHAFDPGMKLFVDFDSFEISGRTASMSFHTTSLSYIDSLNQNYISVSCKLKKKKNGWKVKTIKITPITCCTKLW